MRNWFLVVCAAAAFAPVNSAQAQLPTTLVAGEVKQALGGTCYVNRGLTTFQRNLNTPPVAGAKAVASFSEFFIGLNGNLGWDATGQAVLTFTSATTGTIRFKQMQTAPSAISSGTFTNYSETYFPSITQILVNFTFSGDGGACTLPIGLYLDPSNP